MDGIAKRAWTARMSVSRTPLLTLGIVTYIVSWFAPVLHVLRPGKDMVVGWEAFLFALMSAAEGGSGLWRKTIYVLSAATNVVMVGALVLHLSRRAPYGMLRAMLMASALVNLHWFALNDDRPALRLGYYLWVASFLVVAAGLGPRRDRA
jgi:hypothetical protein